jgi:monoterpene epsilon-lactone hydrolase
MASAEYEAFKARMAAQPVAPPPGSLPELRDRIDAAMGKLPLADGTTAEEVDADDFAGILCTRLEDAGDPTLVYFHGGGYRLASALAYRSFGSHLASVCRARVLLVDYRLAPENPYPAAVEDAVAAYRWVLAGGATPSQVVVAGDSAGGGLAAALLLALRDRGLPLPAGAILSSPWADLTITAATYSTNAATDALFSKASATEAAALYLGDHDPRDPFVSPVFGDWSGIPPLLIQVGDTEVLLDDSARLESVAGESGVEVSRHVYPDMPHVWQTSYPAYPEAVEAVEEMAAFIARVTG